MDEGAERGKMRRYLRSVLIDTSFFSFCNSVYAHVAAEGAEYGKATPPFESGLRSHSPKAARKEMALVVIRPDLSQWSLPCAQPPRRGSRRISPGRLAG